MNRHVAVKPNDTRAFRYGRTACTPGDIVAVVSIFKAASEKTYEMAKG